MSRFDSNSLSPRMMTRVEGASAFDVLIYKQDQVSLGFLILSLLTLLGMNGNDLIFIQ